MPQAKILFQTALRVIGILALIWFLVRVSYIIFSLQSALNTADVMAHGETHFRLALLIQLVSPVLLLIIGIYLLRGGQGIVHLAFRGQTDESNVHASDIFFLFMKIAGLSLLLMAIPDAFQLISNSIMTSASQSFDVGQFDFISKNLVSTVIELILGSYLLISGRLFYKIGFSQERSRT